MYNNTIANITYGGSLYGVYYYGYYFADSKIYNNTISNITNSGGVTYGLYAYYAGTSTFNMYKNKINSLYGTGASSTAQGIFIYQSTSGALSSMPVSIYNNLISDIQAPSSSASPSIVGINFSYSSYNYVGNAFYNTIYLSGSAGATASSAGIYVSSLTPMINLNNNIIINKMVHSGTGIATALWRAGTATTSYGTSSSNNLYYGGIPSVKNLIYYDGTNKDQTVTAFANRVTPAEYGSISENTTFISTTSGNPFYLVPDTTVATVVESGAKNLIAVGTDFAGTIRGGNTGYTGTGIAPDLGAIEGNYLANDLIAPVIQYTPISNTASTGDRTFTATITDYTGVPVMNYVPVVYFKKGYTGSYTSMPGTRVSGNAKIGTWSFTIPASGLGGLLVGDSIYYYLAAQDTSANNNVGSLPGGALGSDVNSIITHPTNPFTYKIVTPLSGNFTVGTTGTYTSLTNVGGAFEAINNSALSGNVTLTITSDLLESGSITLKKWSENGTGGYKVKIVPDGATERLILDTAANTVANSAVITFDGARGATIDGRFNGAGKYLRIRNRGANGIAVLFKNDAVKDTVQYCNLECVTTVTATVVFAGTNVTGGRGNDSNAVMYNNIGDTLGAVAPAGASNTGIFSQGTVGMENDANLIAYNNIYNFGYNAVNMNGTGTGNYWTFYGNNIYQTANRSTTSSYYMFYLSQGYGHVFRKNSIGGAAPDRSGLPIANSGNYWYVFYQSGSSSNVIPNVYDSNTIANFNTPYLYPIYVGGGAATITNNFIGGKQNTWDTIQTTSGFYGIYPSTAGNVVISNNNIGNISYIGGASGYMCGIYHAAYGAVNTVTGNIIHDMVSNGSGSYPTTMYNSGIALYNTNTGGPITIDKNTIYNISNVGTGFASGIGVYYTYSPTTISRNKISGINSVNNFSDGIYGPYYNYNSITYVNNQITINPMNTTGLVTGLHDASQYGSTSNNYYNNSIYVGGVAASNNIGNSYAFYNNGKSLDVIDVRNNIFYNKRTGGLGSAIAVGYTNGNNVLPSTINYNLMVVPDTSKLVETAGTTVIGLSAFNASYSSSSSYNSNWMASVADIPVQTLYTDTASNNLSTVATHANSWYVNGKGIAVSAVANDYNGNARSTTIAAGATDIGAFEFATATLPPAAIASGAPALNGTTTYTFGGKTVASINWGSAGTVPTSVAIQYYTGVNAPSLIASKTQFNSYYSVTPTGGTGYTYNITLSYDSSMFGTVSSSTASKMARYKSPTWNLLSSSSANGTSGMLSSGVAASYLTLPANFTGTDVSNPLPIELLNLRADKAGNDVRVSWATASEMNSSLFEVERSFDEKSFEVVGYVKASGNSNKTVVYSLTDYKVVDQTPSSTIYYRLRMIDRDGSASYSDVVTVNLEKAEDASGVSIYPNPFNSAFAVSMSAAQAGKVTCTVFDISGKIMNVFVQDVSQGMNQIHVDASSLNTGMYFISVELNGVKNTLKISKQ
jgi:hypothetical protein